MSLAQHRKNVLAPFNIAGSSPTDGSYITGFGYGGSEPPPTSPHIGVNNQGGLGQRTIPLPTYRPTPNRIPEQNMPQPIPLQYGKK